MHVSVHIMIMILLRVVTIFYFYIQVPVSPGMVHEQKLPFRGEADQIVSHKRDRHYGFIINFALVIGGGERTQ